MNGFIQFKDWLQNVKLTELEVNNLLAFFQQLDLPDQTLLFKIFKQNPAWIIKITQNLRSKRIACQKKYFSLWLKILDQEQIDLLKVELYKI